MSGIEWTGETWNPVTGCDRISAGCDHCYALTMAARLKAMGQAKYQIDGDPRTSGPGFGVTPHPDALDLPRRWTTPRTIFVNSMSDLFHARVPEHFVREVLDVIVDTPRHTYQALTKRSRRMAGLAPGLPWPVNLHMGVSVEDTSELHRIEDLRRAPAAVRWISAEPLLEPLPGLELDGIGWLVVGGESGPGARPCDVGWIREIRDQCLDAGVPIFIKQLGAVWAGEHHSSSRKGGNLGDWPTDLQVRQWPAVWMTGSAA